MDVNGITRAEVKIPQGVVEGGSHFEPETLKIGKGTTVKWTNEDDTLHTVTSGTPETSSWGTNFDSGYLIGGKTYEHIFKTTGAFNYFCTLHPYMTAKIVVSSKESNPPIETTEKEPSVTVDTIPNRNINISNWGNFTDSENRFSIQYPSYWTIAQSGNRFTKELPLVTVDTNGSYSKIQSQLSVNAFKSNQHFDSNSLAKYAYNQLVKQSTGSTC